MKIWNGYGSEHSMNLVMIGHFKSSDDAEKTKILIDKLTKGVEGKIDVGTSGDRYSDEIMKILREEDCYILRPSELEQFLYDVDAHVEEKKIILKTDESEVSAFFKLMVLNGAKVEIYSAHNYPETDPDQEK